MRFLIAGEPIDTFHPELDTGVVLSHEILRRGHSLDYCNLATTPYDVPTEKYLTELPVAEVKKVALGVTPAFELGPQRKVSAEDYKVILQRKDPPVDDAYRGHAKHFATLPESIVQMNDPNMTTRYSEHLLPQRYPGFACPTYHCNSFEEFVAWITSAKGEMVAKPLHLFSGMGVEFFSAATDEKVLREYWNKYKPHVVVQPYLPEVTTLGDVRILVINGCVIGAVRRMPKTGSRLANLHQGATSEPATATPKQLQACAVVAADLCPRGLYFLGLDFIGDFLTEVNITCPSALRQVNAMNGVQGERTVIDALEDLARKV